MNATITSFLALFFFPAAFAQYASYDWSSRGSCPGPYNAAVKACDIVDGSFIFVSEQQNQCVCNQNPTWDTNIIDCVINWVNPAISNGGNGGELSTALWYEIRIRCSPRPSSSANLSSTDAACSSVWKIIHTCGGYGKDLETCICKYKYLWITEIGATGSMTDCPTVIEQAGDLTMGSGVRTWQSFACGPAPWIHKGSDSSSTSDTTTSANPGSSATVPLSWGLSGILLQTFLVGIMGIYWA